MSQDLREDSPSEFHGGGISAPGFAFIRLLSVSLSVIFVITITIVLVELNSPDRSEWMTLALLGAVLLTLGSVPLGYALTIRRALRANVRTEDSATAAGSATTTSTWEIMASALPVGVFLLNAEGELVRINKRLEETLGFTLEGMQKRTMPQLIMPEDREGVIAEWKARAGVRERFVQQFKVLRADGEIVWVNVQAAPILSASGEITGYAGTVEDVTSREEANASLRDSEARYRSIVEDQQDIIARFTPDGRLTFVNEAACRLVEKTREELIGQSYNPTVYPADRERVALRLLAMTPENPGEPMENRLVDPRGNPRWYLWTNQPIFDANGNFVEWQTIGRDVHERKLAEEALKESEQKFRALCEASPIGIWQSDSKGLVVYLNRRAAEIAARPPAELLGEAWGGVVHPDDLSRVLAIWHQASIGAQPYSNQWRLVRPDGEIRWIHVSGGPTFNAENEFTGHVGTSEDITERLASRRLLESSERNYRLVATHAPVGIFQADPQGSFIFVNQHWCRFTGLSSEQSLGDGWLKALFPEDRTRVFQSWFDTVREGRDFTMKFRIQRPKNQFVWVQCRAAALHGEHGELAGFVGSVREIADHQSVVRVREEVVSAAKMPHKIVPTLTNGNGRVQFAWAYRPCEELGGAMLNVVDLGNQQAGLYVLDVTGHGVDAAQLSMGVMKLLSPPTELNSLLGSPDPSNGHCNLTPPAEVARELNRRYKVNPQIPAYLTLLYGILDLKTGEFRYASAGHPGPVRCSGSGQLTQFDPGTIPIGLLPDAEFQESRIQLAPGDRLYLYSTGIVDSGNPRNGGFGESRLRAFLRDHHERDLQQVLDDLVSSVESFCGEGAPLDDLTALAVEVRGD